MAKILLIDDDPDLRMLTTNLLTGQGYQVVTASQPEEALAKLGEEKPSLILLDVLLSGFDGRELCRQLKADEGTRRIPVVMLSAHPGAAQHFERYGADDFIAKPFTAEALLNKLSQCLNSMLT